MTNASMSRPAKSVAKWNASDGAGAVGGRRKRGTAAGCGVGGRFLGGGDAAAAGAERERLEPPGADGAAPGGTAIGATATVEGPSLPLGAERDGGSDAKVPGKKAGMPPRIGGVGGGGRAEGGRDCRLGPDRIVGSAREGAGAPMTMAQRERRRSQQRQCASQRGNELEHVAHHALRRREASSP